MDGSSNFDFVHRESSRMASVLASSGGRTVSLADVRACLGDMVLDVVDDGYSFDVSLFGSENGSENVPGGFDRCVEALDRTVFRFRFSEKVTEAWRGRSHLPLYGKPRYWWKGFVGLYEAFCAAVPGLRGPSSSGFSTECHAVAFVSLVLGRVWRSEDELNSGAYGRRVCVVNSILRHALDFCARGSPVGVDPDASSLAAAVCTELGFLGILDRKG